MHKLAILALDGVVPFDLGIACDVFSRVRLTNGKAAYDVRVCSERDHVRTGSFDLRAPGRLRDVVEADTTVVPGVEDVDAPFSRPAIASIQAAWRNGGRVISICSGAFVLGAAGLLDNRQATTHWIAAEKLARRFPSATVRPNVLFVDEGRLLTSAGASAGLDMCLHLIRRDHGQAIAAQAARLAVAPLNRDGGQAQFIQHPLPGTRSSLASTLDWIEARLDQPLDVPAMAARAGMSERTFARRFRAQTGSTPLQWLIAARVRRAQELLESTSASIEEVALKAGFESPVTFRARFHRIVGLSPYTWRRRFKADVA